MILEMSSLVTRLKFIDKQAVVMSRVGKMLNVTVSSRIFPNLTLNSLISSGDVGVLEKGWIKLFVPGFLPI